jgi:hypothetical protein
MPVESSMGADRIVVIGYVLVISYSVFFGVVEIGDGVE